MKSSVADVMKEEEEDEEQPEPLFRHPFYRNRVLFGIFDICLLLLNSFSLHRWIAGMIIDTPSTDNILTAMRKLRNDTRDFSNDFIDQLQEKDAQFQLDLNETVTAESLHVEGLLAINQDMVLEQISRQLEAKQSYDSSVSFIQAWSRIGNEVPYFDQVTYKEMLLLETSFGFEDGTIVGEIQQDSDGLKRSVQSRLSYDYAYFYNKTFASIPNVIPLLGDAIQFPASLEIDIPAIADEYKNRYMAALVTIRGNLGAIYDSLVAHLGDTQASFEDIAEGYETLINTLTEFYEVLGDINLIGFSANAFPSIDLSLFPPVNSFRPPAVPFPTTEIYLKAIDDLLLALDGDFDLMVTDILNVGRVAIDIQADDAIATVVGFLTPDDYDPPAIEYKGKTLSPMEAISLDADLTANLTAHLNVLDTSFSTDDPILVVPDISFDRNTFEYVRPEVEIFTWTLPNVDEFLLWVDDWLRWIWKYYTKIEVAFINVYRAMRRAFEYFEGTAVALPTVDLRTAREMEEKKKRRTKRGGDNKATALAAYFFHPLVAWFCFRVIPVLLFVAAMFVGYTYYSTDFHPNCILSNNGSKIGNQFVGPVVHNQALVGGQQYAAYLSARNYATFLEQCHSRTDATREIYRGQFRDFETSRATQVIAAGRYDNLFDLVDQNELCQRHTDACERDDSPYACSGNETDLANPCDFVDSHPFPPNETLITVDFDCTSLARGNLTVDGFAERAEEELNVQENWCLAEWWVLSHIVRFLYIVCSYLMLRQAFMYLIIGLQTYFWQRMRPEEFHIHCTADIRGVYTQPEYTDDEAKKEAIKEWVITNRRWGILWLLVSGLMITGWVFVAMYVAKASTSPDWLDDITSWTR